MQDQIIKIKYVSNSGEHNTDYHVINLRKKMFADCVGWVKFYQSLLMIRIRYFSLLTFLTTLIVVSCTTFFTISEYKKIEITKHNLTVSVRNGFQYLKDGAEKTSVRQWSDARNNFQLSFDVFKDAREQTLNTNSIIIKLATLFSFSVTDNIWHILKAGESLAVSANYVVDLLEGISGLNNISLTESIRRDHFISTLELVDRKLVDVITYLTVSTLSADFINENYIPRDLRHDFVFAKNSLAIIRNSFQKAHTILSLGKEVFAKGNKKYLFVFQNNNELRATGGFLGSFAVVSLKNGKVVNINVPGGGSYDLQGSLQQNLISPAPLQLINPRWEFQDSNWWPDFPTSAKKMTWFYNQAGGVNAKNENLADRIFGVLEADKNTVSHTNLIIDDKDKLDGVIAINATFVEDLLKVLGTVNTDKYNRIITANNFIVETQKIVEIEYDKKKNKPKEFIGDFAVELIKHFQDLNFVELSGVLSVMAQGLAEKDIMVYLKDVELQNVVDRLGWSGRVSNIDPNTDYLYVVHTNIAGGKTDAVMKNSVKHISTVVENGRIINTVEITRLHTGKKGDGFTGIRNVNYMRVYVPFGSKLISAIGFNKPDKKWFSVVAPHASVDYDVATLDDNSITDSSTGTIIGRQFGKTFFGNWTQTDPGTLSTVRLVYELPFTLGVNNNIYKMLIQKQSGLRAQDYVSSDLVVSDKYHIVYQHGKNVTQDGGGLSYKEKNNKEDIVWGAIIGQ